MKTTRKALAIFLSVLMALSMCSMLGAVAFAVDAPEGYEILPTSADDLDPGDWYFDLDAYVAELIELGRDADAERYQTTEYFIKEDHSAMKVFNQNYYDQGRPDPFENYDSDTPIFESFVKQAGFGPWEQLHLIDTYDDVAYLLVGWYYTYKTVFADFYHDGDSVVVYTDEYMNFKIVVNGNATVIENGVATEDFEIAIMQRDTDSAWVALPLSPEGLDLGDRYFDKAAVLEDEGISEEEFTEYFFDTIYTDDEGNFKVTSTNVYGDGPDDYVVFDTIIGKYAMPEDWEYFNNYVKAVTLDQTDMILLPKSADGLADGTLWLDTDAYAAYLSSQDYSADYIAASLAYEYYLDPEATTIYYDKDGYLMSNPFGKYGIWNCIQCAGYEKLPHDMTVDTPRVFDSYFAYANFSEYNSETGESVYSPEFEVYNVYYAIYYLSNDGDNIIVMTREGKKEFDRATNLYNIFDYIKTNPLEGATLLPTSDEGLEVGDMWLDIESYLSSAVNYMEPDTFAYVEQEIRGSTWYLAADGETVFGVNASNRIIEYGIEYYLKIVGYDPYAGLVPIVYDLAEIEEVGIYLEKEPFYAYFLEVVGIPEEEAEEFLSEIDMYSFYYNPETGEISMAIEQYGYIESYSIDELQAALDEINEALAQAEEGSDEYNNLMEEKDSIDEILPIMSYIRDNMLIMEVREQEGGEDVPEEAVVIYAAPEVIDEDALLVVVPDVEISPELHQAIKELSELEKKVILQQNAYDVKLMKGDVAIQPNGSIKLRFPVPENAAPEKVIVLHALENGSVQKVSSKVMGDYVYADSDGLSIYLVAEVDVCTHANLTPTEAKASTCQVPGNDAYWTCDDCGAFFSDANGETEIEADSWVLDIDPDNHTPAEAVKENDTPSTCDTLGSYDSVVYCDVCGEELSRDTVDYTEYAAHTPGEELTENDVASTCNTLGGYDLVVRCTVCGAVISSTHTDYTAYADHQFGDWADEQPASCEAAGVKGHKTCAVCGKNFDAEGVEIEDLAIAKLPHTPGDPVGAVEATCSAAGYTGDIKCTVCGATITAGTAIAKLPHELGEWVTTKEASCSEEGTQTRSCANCDYSETKAIEKTAHSYADGVCTVCGAKEKHKFHWMDIIRWLIEFFHKIFAIFQG